MYLFYENISNGYKVIERSQFSYLQMWYNVIIYVGRVTFLFSAHCLIMFYICSKFRENILREKQYASPGVAEI